MTEGFCLFFVTVMNPLGIFFRRISFRDLKNVRNEKILIEQEYE